MIKESGGVCPTHDELAKEMNVSVNAAITMVQRLVRRGHLQKPARMHRAMRVVNHGRASA
jgi:Mn-dependent DtxR family transcriptional regulator